GIPICTMSLLTGISFILFLSAILTESSFFYIKKACTYLTNWTYADKLHTFSWHYKIKNEQQNWIYARLLLV
ncbi:hypothetical protein, partial [Roseburia faecis]|uniref:hypothetical protein n=1 Tax=Roseburia faecis TaxID=301302 RepID=UPI001A9BCFF0